MLIYNNLLETQNSYIFLLSIGLYSLHYNLLALYRRFADTLVAPELAGAKIGLELYIVRKRAMSLCQEDEHTISSISSSVRPWTSGRKK